MGGGGGVNDCTLPRETFFALFLIKRKVYVQEVSAHTHLFLTRFALK